MFDVHDTQFLTQTPTDEALPYGSCVADLEESMMHVQFSRIASRPLTTTVERRIAFFSLKGRTVCLIKIAQSFFRESFRFFKNIVAIAVIALLLFLNIINIPFSKNARAIFVNLFVANISICCGLFIRPITFIVDLVKFAAGAVFAPKFAIHLA